MSLPLTMFFITTAKDSIFLLAGREYADAILPMRIITFAVIAIGITNILGVQVLTAIGKEKYVLVSVTIGAITDLLLNSIWIPKYSSAGAALSTTIAEYMVLIVQLLMVRRLIAFEIAKVKMLRYVISVIPSITITLLASRSLHFHSFFNLLVEAIIFGGIYLAIMIFIKDKYLNLMINILRTKIMRKDVDNV